MVTRKRRCFQKPFPNPALPAFSFWADDACQNCYRIVFVIYEISSIQFSRMPRNLPLFFLFLFFTISPYSQQNKTKPDFKQLYNLAEKLFHSPDANERTDSLALGTYLNVISLLTRERIYNEIL